MSGSEVRNCSLMKGQRRANTNCTSADELQSLTEHQRSGANAPNQYSNSSTTPPHDAGDEDDNYNDDSDVNDDDYKTQLKNSMTNRVEYVKKCAEDKGSYDKHPDDALEALSKVVESL